MIRDGTASSKKRPPAGLWACLDATNLVIERFDDEYILYNRLSGETHVLNRESKLILDAVSSRSISLDEVRNSISSESLNSPDISLEQIQEHLALLEQLGIVENVR